MSDVPRPEHPKPQFERESWINLNGTWDFAFDFGVSGVERGWAQDLSGFGERIVVPFCPESSLSGIGYTDFIPCVWYHRTFDVPAGWQGMKVFLHFGAVDYDCRVWINGTPVGRHYGGSSSFCFEITEALKDGVTDVTVCAVDDLRSGVQPGGKQCPEYASRGCLYTRVTGIWQTVWLEARPEGHIDSVRIIPDFDAGRFVIVPRIVGHKEFQQFRAALLIDGTVLAEAYAAAGSGAPAVLDIDDPHEWSPDEPFLYDLQLDLVSGDEAVDSVKSYAGLRKIHIEGNRIFLNNEPIFLRFVLDQGFYPDGIWTAPSDAELKGDIERAMAVGFNGARLHQKVFEERFHYWADRLGYLTWGEFCDWGPARDFAKPQAVYNLHTEWREVVMRDTNHPAIIAWTPTNETRLAAGANLERHRRTIQDLVDLTRALDPSRPINDASGYVHVDTDIYTDHNYEQNPDEFRKQYAALAPDAKDGFHINQKELSVPYRGQPFVVDEYGGTWWRPEHADEAAETGADRKQSWGYGKTPESVEEVYHRIEELTKVLTEHPHVSGFTYTQLTDVEQEENGIYTYDRKPKFDAERLRKAFGAPAAIERSGP